MKKIILIVTFLVSHLMHCQVPDWIKNALPVTDKHLKKIEKKGNKYIEKFRSYSEGSEEKKIYYRVRYINYLKRLETIEDEISKKVDGERPGAFPLFANTDKTPYLIPYDDIIEESMENIKFIENDTILNVVDLLDPDSENLFPVEHVYLDNYKVIVSDANGGHFELIDAYNKKEIEDYPHFKVWRDKYILYSRKEFSDKRKQASEMRIAEEEERRAEALQLERVGQEKLKENAAKVTCNTKTDDFTGVQEVYTNQKRLVSITNSLGYDMFVCSLKTIKKGNRSFVEVYFYFNTNRPLDFYGIIRKNDKMEFKLENGKVVQLKFIETTVPTTKIKYKYSYYENYLWLNEKSISDLTGSPISKIRIHFTKGYKDYDITEDRRLLIKQLECINFNE